MTLLDFFGEVLTIIGNNGENSAFAILCSCDLMQNGGNEELTTRVK